MGTAAEERPVMGQLVNKVRAIEELIEEAKSVLCKRKSSQTA